MTDGFIRGDDRITSSESEGAFNEFIEDQLDELIEGIITDGDLSELGERGSDLVIEMDDITPPTFVYGQDGRGGGGGGSGPGSDGGKMRFTLEFQRLMELVARKLKLPRLIKEGMGRIKQVSYEYKTFGPMGVILDKKRTFKRALKTSVATGMYRPQDDQFDVQIRRRDRRYKIPQRVEKPRYRAVVFYMGDISYSTYGERLELEKRLVAFIQNWLDFNYGPSRVEHRFFVHDMEAYEVMADDFYRVSNVGGTRAAIVFDLVSQVAFNEYDTTSTNFYAFYFGDGELFADDAKQIVDIINNHMVGMFNRVGVIEVQPSRASHLITQLSTRFARDEVVRLGEIKHRKDTIEVIRSLFGDGK